jgi:hypothetical protein
MAGIHFNPLWRCLRCDFGLLYGFADGGSAPTRSNARKSQFHLGKILIGPCSANNSSNKKYGIPFNPFAGDSNPAR